MISPFETKHSSTDKNTPDDPWTAATLLPDSSPEAWLVSYIDILILLVTLLVLLLALQNRTLEKNATTTMRTEVVTQLQAPTNRRPIVPLALKAPEATLPVAPTAEISANPDDVSGDTVASAPEQRTESASKTVQWNVPSTGRQKSATGLNALRTTNSGGSTGEQFAVRSTSTGRQKSATGLNALRATNSGGSTGEQFAVRSTGDLQDQVEFIREAEHIRLEINDTVFFESGSADMKTQSTTLLEKLVEMLKRHPGRIAIEGHTDDRPIATTRYPSNWELSAARASMVARYLIMHGIEADRLQAIGYADTRPRSTNDSEAGRAHNRRVTLMIYPHQP
jgi:chemotaxis protein MotB